jgi:predicted oxidoreductase
MVSRRGNDDGVGLPQGADQLDCFRRAGRVVRVVHRQIDVLTAVELGASALSFDGCQAVAQLGLARTIESWNRNVAAGSDRDFGRGSSAYDGYWGDERATTLAGKTLGPIDTPPYYAVPVSVGAMGTKGGPRTDRDGHVLHVSGAAIPALFAAGNAMASVTGRAYGGAGGTIGPAMVFGFRAGYAAATGKSVES